MTFLNPIGFIFLTLAPVLVLLYLRRVRRRAVAVSSLMFWQRALGEQRHRAWFGKLRRFYSLLFQLLVLLLLVFALSRPAPRPGLAKLAESGSTVLVIDARARMQAKEPDGQTRFAKAILRARQALSGMREGSSTAVLLAGAMPEVVSPFVEDPIPLNEKLGQLSPSDAAGDLGATLSLAQELIATRPGSRRILVFTDSTTSADGTHRAKAAAPPVEPQIIGVGSPLDNVAITRFAARPQLGSPQTADLLLEVANFGRKPVRGNVEITCEGRLLDVKAFELLPGAKKSQVYPAVPTTAGGLGRLTARLDTKDALALDNTAYALLPSNDLCRVLLVTRGNFFLEKLLASDNTVQFELLSPESFQPTMAGSFDAVIFDGCGPATLAEVPGNALFLKSGPLMVSGTLDQPLVTDTDPESPLLRLVQWEGVNFLRSAQIAMPKSPAAEQGGWSFQAPLRSFENPLILTGARRKMDVGSDSSGTAEQRLAAFAFDVAETDLPLRLAFPLLISNTLHWLAGSDALVAQSVECGQAVTLGPEEAAQAESVPGPKGTAVAGSALPVSKGSLLPLHAGFYRIDSPAGAHRVAVNLFQGNESDLRAVADPGRGDNEGFGVGDRLLNSVARPLWQWLTLAALALFSAEWWLFHRRKTE